MASDPDPTTATDLDPTLTALPSHASSPGVPLPAAIGHYRILRLIGEGGMGAVYEAEQENPRRTVALKVIKPGLASPELLRRFEQEAQALGRLHHPGIAQIYEAGAADTGFGPQPYFAMELIQGRTLTDFARERSLTMRQRIELMSRICEAIQHAHQRGLIHRDLKPGNILVDESGQPKVLDFGVARVTDSDARATRHTDIGQLIGTLAYMSPEQALADPLELDTRSDVYTLGVILYEFLAGHLPYKISATPLHEAIRTIRETDPAPLSSVERIFRGDVETIVSKALEKDKTRRYSSAADMAADLRRYLTHEPIVARPATTMYQLSKFARRHKALVGGIAAVFVVLVAGIAASTLEALRANREAATATALNNFLRNDLLAQASSTSQSGAGARPDPELKVRTALDRASARVAGRFSAQPAVEAAVRETIGSAYFDMGLYSEARTQFQRALTLNRQTFGPRDLKSLSTAVQLARNEVGAGRYQEAEAIVQPIVETAKRVLGPANPETIRAMNALGIAYWRLGKRELAAKTLDEILSHAPADDPGRLRAMSNRAQLYSQSGKFAEAERLGAQVLDICRRRFGPEDPMTLMALGALGVFYGNDNKPDQAASIFAEAIEVNRRVLGPEHPETISDLANLASAQLTLRKFGEAEANLNRALDITTRILGPEHPDTLHMMGNLAVMYEKLGKYAQAEALEKRVLEAQRRILGPEHSMTLISLENLAVEETLQNKFAEAENAIFRCLDARRRTLGPDDPATLRAEGKVSWILERQGKFGEAEKYGRSTLDDMTRVLGAENTDTAGAGSDLAFVFLRQGKFKQGEPLARQALAVETKLEPEDWSRFNDSSLLGAILTGEKRFSEAEPLLLDGYRGMLARRDRVEHDLLFQLGLAQQWIVSLYQRWGKPEKAAEWRGKTS